MCFMHIDIFTHINIFSLNNHIPLKYFFSSPISSVDSELDWLQSLKQFFHHILVASITVKIEPPELDWLQVYGITH